MQIALIHNLSDALKTEFPPMDTEADPLFTWTANWVPVWEKCYKRDLLVLVNRAACFTVAVYQVKRADLVRLPEIIEMAIYDTFTAMNLNPTLIDEYMKLAGKIEFVKNTERKDSYNVTVSCKECAYEVGRKYNSVDKIFCDTIGNVMNTQIVHAGKLSKEMFIPYRRMFKALSERTGLPRYKYRAFELMCVLDLKLYKATRKIIVPTNITFHDLHTVLQAVFNWKNTHQYYFYVSHGKKVRKIAKILPAEELTENSTAKSADDKTVEDYLTSKDRKIYYVYDPNDNWEHEIELVRVIEDYDKESPYLEEAIGQAPPEDIGGVEGFLEFRKIIADVHNPEYFMMRSLAPLWEEELGEFDKNPRILYL